MFGNGRLTRIQRKILMFPFPVGPVGYMLLHSKLNNHDGVKYFDVFDDYHSK